MDASPFVTSFSSTRLGTPAQRGSRRVDRSAARHARDTEFRLYIIEIPFGRPSRILSLYGLDQIGQPIQRARERSARLWRVYRCPLTTRQTEKAGNAGQFR